MVLVSYSGREINAKLVYYGPGLSGKTTNLEYIYGSIPQGQRGKMVSMKTKTERTLFFDFLPVHLGELSGFKTRFLLYTVPGQVYYNATRKLVLKGVDAVVFVADSKRGKMDENVESLENLRENLREHGFNLDQIPWVLQYNKRDLPDVYSLAELEGVLNAARVPSFEAVATTGQGVVETFKGVSRLLLKRLAREIGVSVVGTESPASEEVAPAPPHEAALPKDPEAPGGLPAWNGAVRFTSRASEPPSLAADPASAAPEPPPPIPLPGLDDRVRRSPAGQEPAESRPRIDSLAAVPDAAPPGSGPAEPWTPEFETSAPRSHWPRPEMAHTVSEASLAPVSDGPRPASGGAPEAVPAPAEPIDTEALMRDLGARAEETAGDRAQDREEDKEDRPLSVGERLRRWLSRGTERSDAAAADSSGSLARVAPDRGDSPLPAAESPRDSSKLDWGENAELTPDLTTRSGRTDSALDSEPPDGAWTQGNDRMDAAAPTPEPSANDTAHLDIPGVQEARDGQDPLGEVGDWDFPSEAAEDEASMPSSPQYRWAVAEEAIPASAPVEPALNSERASGWDRPLADWDRERISEPEVVSERPAVEEASAAPSRVDEPGPPSPPAPLPSDPELRAAVSAQARFPSMRGPTRPREVIVPIEIYPEDLENGITFKLAFQAPWWQTPERDEEVRGAA